MTDIVKRLKNINEESLIMTVVRDCMDAAQEIEDLRAELDSKSTTLKQIMLVIRNEGVEIKAQNKKRAKSK